MGTRDMHASGRPAELGGRRGIWPWVVVAAAAVAVVAAVLGYRTVTVQPGVSKPDQGNRHIQTINESIPAYNSEPPTSGPHLPYIAPWGIHTEPIPRQLQVHNLEDGGVVVQYNCPDACPDLVAKLTALVSGYERQVILAPYPGMETRIALTAWTRLDGFDELDPTRVHRFITAYRGIDHHPR